MKAYSVDLHQKILKAAVAKRGTRDQIATMFGVSVRLVQNIVRRHRAGEEVGPKRGHVGTPKIEPEHETVLRELVVEQPDATLDELVVALEARGGPRVSRSAMATTLQRLKLPRKKSIHAAERDSERVKRMRALYQELITTWLIGQLKFVDEMGINLAMTRSVNPDRQTSATRSATSPAGTNRKLSN